jgi:hypothetical protein
VAIGFLEASASSANHHFLDAFKRGLGELGYVEGQNLTIEERWTDGPGGAVCHGLPKRATVALCADSCAWRGTRRFPARAVVAFDLGQGRHPFQVLSANLVLDGQYRNLGLLLGVLATLVAGADFGSRREFDLFTLVSIVTYLGLSVTIGILFGGGWIRMVHEVARPTHPDEPASWS